jgi:hypothetical protein
MQRAHEGVTASAIAVIAHGFRKHAVPGVKPQLTAVVICNYDGS